MLALAGKRGKMDGRRRIRGAEGEEVLERRSLTLSLLHTSLPVGK